MGGGTGNNNLSGGTANFVPMFTATVSNSEDAADQVIPVAGTLSMFIVRLNGVPGAGRSYTFFVRRNGIDTAVTCTISGNTERECSDDLNSADFVAGDRISIRSQPTGDPSGRRMRWTARFATAN